jgi:HTH-type transcriptional regulator, sugar sensing transcriptional regulator
MDISILKKLGLSEKEIKTYLKLLENGPSSVRMIAQAAELNRGTAYDILKDLMKMGLVSYFHKDTKQHFTAEDPSRLIKFLASREDELKIVKNKIEEIIPELKLLQNTQSNKPVTKYYEGSRGIKFILSDILSTMKEEKNKEYFIYSAPGIKEDVYAAYPEFIKKRIKYKIKVKTISLSEGGGTYGLDERKWLINQKNKLIPAMTYIIIYSNKCAFISRDKSNKPVGVIIENNMIYETQKIIFLQLWSLLK